MEQDTDKLFSFCSRVGDEDFTKWGKYSTIKRHYKRRGGQFENFSPSSHHRYVQMQGLLFWQCPGAYVQGE